MKKTIVYLSEFAEMGGAENSLIRLIRGMVDDYNVYLLSPEGELSKLAVLAGATHVELNFPQLRARKFFSNKKNIFIALDKIIQLDRKYEGVIFHANTFRTRVYLTLVSYFLRSKLVGHIRDFNCSLFNTLLTFTLDKTIVISKFVESSIRYKNDRRIKLIYNGVEDLSNYKSSGYLLNRGASKGNYKVVLLGRIEEWKNQHLLIEAAKVMSNIRNDIDFYIVGSPMKEAHIEYYNSICDLAKGADFVHILGHTKEPFDVLKEADLLICPSNNEPFGRVVIEALSIKTPVIGSNNGGVKEILEKVSLDLMFDPLDLVSMSDKISKYLNRDLFNKEVELGYQVYLREFSIENNIKSIKLVYEELYEQ